MGLWALVLACLLLPTLAAALQAVSCDKDRTCNLYCSRLQDKQLSIGRLELVWPRKALACQDSDFGPEAHAVFEHRLSFFVPPSRSDLPPPPMYSLCAMEQVQADEREWELIQLQLINTLDRIFLNTPDLNASVRCIDTPSYFRNEYCYPDKTCVHDVYYYIAIGGQFPTTDWLQLQLLAKLEAEAPLALRPFLSVRRAWRGIHASCAALRRAPDLPGCPDEDQPPPPGHYTVSLDVTAFPASLRCWELPAEPKWSLKPPYKQVSSHKLLRQKLVLRLLSSLGPVCLSPAAGQSESSRLGIQPGRAFQTADEVKAAVGNASFGGIVFAAVDVKGDFAAGKGYSLRPFLLVFLLPQALLFAPIQIFPFLTHVSFYS